MMRRGAFGFLKAIRRSLAAAFSARHAEQQFVLESFEPRLLLSADAVPVVPETVRFLADTVPPAIVAALPGSASRSAADFVIDWRALAPTSPQAMPATTAGAPGELTDPALAAFPGAEAAIRTGLSELARFGDKVDAFDALAAQIPYLNEAIGNVLDLGGILQTAVVDPLLAYLDDPSGFPTAGDGEGVPNTDGVVAALRSSLGALDPAAAVGGGVTQQGNEMLFAIDFQTAKSRRLPIDFSTGLVDLGVALTGEVEIDLTTSLALQFDFGVDLAGGTISADSFFVRMHDLRVRAQANASGVNVGASIGALGASVANGAVELEAEIALAFADGTISLSELAETPMESLLTPSATSTLAATLPVRVSVGGFIVAGSPTIEVNDDNLFAVPAPVVQLQDFDQLFDIDQLFGGFSASDGLDQLLGVLQSQLQEGVFGNELPLVGGKLKEAATFIAQLRGEDADHDGTLGDGEDTDGDGRLDQGLVGQLRNLQDRGLSLFQQAIFDALGPAGNGIGVLALDKDAHDAGSDGLPDAAADANDVEFALTSNALRFDLRLHQDLVSATIPVDFDIGLPALGLELAGDVDLRLGYDFAFGFGVQHVGDTVEFFLDTLATNTNGDPVPELTVNVEVSIPDLIGVGSLGFLRLRVADEDADANAANDWNDAGATPSTVDVDGDGILPSRLAGVFTVDLTSPAADGMLRVSDLASLGVDARLNADADINLELTVDVGSAMFPSFSTEFALDWRFDNADTAVSDAAAFGNRPQLSFNHTSMNLGAFLDRFAGPLLYNINRVLEPLQRINNFLQERMPLLSDFSALRDVLDGNGDGKVTLLDLAKKAEGITGVAINTDIFDAIDTLLGLSDSIRADASGIHIPLDLGSRSLGPTFDIRSPSATLAEAQLAGDAPRPKEEQVTGEALDLLDRLSRVGILIAPFNGSGGALNADPIFDLILGKQDVTLVTWDPPAAVLGSEVDPIFQVDFPIFPGFLSASIGGNLFLRADLAFGYDTAGLNAFRASGFSDAGKLADGFFVWDVAPATGNDVTELELKGSIVAGATARIPGLVRASVKGDVTATIGFNLHDIDPDGGAGPQLPDGKIRLNEIARRVAIGDAFAVGPLAVFDLSGTLSAGLSASIWTGIKIPFDGKLTLFEARKELFRGTLLDYNLTFPDEVPTTQVPALATQQASTLTLNTTAGDDTFTIAHLAGSASDAAGESVTVTAFNRTERFDGVKHIIANAGDGNDVLTLQDQVTATATLSGGNGNDVLRAGSGAARLDGGQGKDVLVGGAGDDIIRDSGQVTLATFDGTSGLYSTDADDRLLGNGGNDQVDGGAGIDWLEGGSGIDTLEDTGTMRNEYRLVNIATGDTEVFTDADDVLFGDTSDPEGVADTGDDVLDGGAGNDRLAGGQGSDTLRGNDGDDILLGNAGDDALDGGTGDDALNGGAGNDRYTFAPDWGSDHLEDASGDDTTNFAAVTIGLLGEFSELGMTVSDGTSGNVLHGQYDQEAEAIKRYVDSVEHFIAGSAADRLLIVGAAQALDVDGGPGNDTVLGADRDASWEIFADNAVYVDGLSFHATENILAGNGNDHFRMAADVGLSGRVDGGLGIDTLDYSSYRTNVAASLRAGSASNVSGGVSGLEHLIGGQGADRLVGDANANHLVGNGGDDTLEGDAGDDTLAGDAGNDRFVFSGLGLGHDTLLESDNTFSNDLHDLLDFSAFGGGVAISLHPDAGIDPQTVNGSNLSLTLSSALAFEDLIGSAAFGNDLEGNARNNTLTGGTRTDELLGHAGDDIYVFNEHWGTDGVLEDPDEGNDTFDFSGVTRPLTANVAADNRAVTDGVNLVIPWLDPAQNLLTGSGDDRVVFADASTIAGFVDGGPGSDLLDYSGYDLTAVVNLSEYVATGVGGEVVRIEGVLGSKGNDRLFGDDASNRLVGNDGDDQIIGRAGNDVLEGGAGEDMVLGGTDNDLLDGGDGNDRLDGGEGEDRVQGAAGNDELYGGAGDDLLEGGAGDDLVYGDAGNDRYRFAGGTLGHDTIFESAGIGGDPANDRLDTLDFSAFIDSISVNLASSASQSINATNLDLTLIDGEAIEGVVGSAFADRIDGNARDNVLEGGHGDDGLFGYAGNDRYVFAGGNLGSDLVVETGTLDTANDAHDGLDFSAFAGPVQIDLGESRRQVVHADHLRLALQSPTGIEAVTGSHFDDTIIGNVRDNVYLFTDAWGRDSVFETADHGNDTCDLSAVSAPIVVQVSEMRFTSGVNLVASTGEKVENVVAGQNDDRFEFGASGAATGYLDGGAGFDTLNYAGYRTAVRVDLHTGTVSGVGAAATNMENIVGSKQSDDLTGNDAANRIESNGGDDTIAALGGNDVIRVPSQSVKVDAGAGTDTLQFTGASLDLTDKAGTTLQSIERIDLAGSGSNRLIVDGASVSTLAHPLLVMTDTKDVVVDRNGSQVGSDATTWRASQGGPEPIDGKLFAVYEHTTVDQATLKISQCLIGDFDCDGDVDKADLAIIARAIQEKTTDLGYDLNDDGKVNAADARKLATLFTAAPRG